MNEQFVPVIVTLSNGLRVANFSSNHPFTFVDGTVLPAVSDELCASLSMESKEIIYDINYLYNDNHYSSIILSFFPSKEVHDAIAYWRRQWYLECSVDVVIVPLPVISMMRNVMNLKDADIFDSPFRTIRVADRLTKKIFIDKFCI